MNEEETSLIIDKIKGLFDNEAKKRKDIYILTIDDENLGDVLETAGFSVESIHNYKQEFKSLRHNRKYDIVFVYRLIEQTRNPSRFIRDLHQFIDVNRFLFIITENAKSYQIFLNGLKKFEHPINVDYFYTMIYDETPGLQSVVEFGYGLPDSHYYTEEYWRMRFCTYLGAILQNVDRL